MTDIKNPMLVDFSKDLAAPPMNMLTRLNIGDYAKVAIGKQQVWVRIKSRNGNDFVGKVRNNCADLKRADMIAFKCDNITDLWFFPKEALKQFLKLTSLSALPLQ